MRRTAQVTVVFVAAALAAVAMTAADVRLAAPASLTLTAQRAEQVPDDVWSGFWKRAPALDVPVSAQDLIVPKGGRTGGMKARSVHDGSRLYVLLEWEDETPDDAADTPQQFPDKAAVQFPAVAGERVPAFCMGDPQAGVNIWLWDASHEPRLAVAGVDGLPEDSGPMSDWYPLDDQDVFYPSRAAGNVVATAGAVQTLVANVFGSLTAAGDQTADGSGAWKDGKWRVLFTRDLPAGEDAQTDFSVPESTNVAFAVWDGASGDRNGQKSVGQFVSLRLSQDALAPASGMAFGTVAAAAALVVALAGIGMTYAVVRRAASGRRLAGG